MTKISNGTAHTMPADIRKALRTDAKALVAWEDLTPLGRNEWICWVTFVKQNKTRQEHVARLLSEIKQGKRRPCCWIGCIHRTDKAISPSIQGILAKTIKEGEEKVKYTMAGFANTITKVLSELTGKGDFPYFVETGTFKGKTIEFAAGIFKQVYTIELNKELFEENKEKFKSIKNITCLKGDSPVVLNTIMPQLNADTIFFLDAHWSGELSSRSDSDTPLLKELEIISKRRGYNDIIIIDDVSFMGRKGSLPRPNPTQYFPKGGIFYWDWKHVTKDKVLSFFPGKKYFEKDDRLLIRT